MFWCESLPHYRNVMLVCIYTLQQIILIVENRKYSQSMILSSSLRNLTSLHLKTNIKN